MDEVQRKQCRDLAKKIRLHCLRMVYRGKSGHIGSMLSTADIYAVLYNQVLNVSAEAPKAADRDRFILSKGHGGAALLAALAEKGFFPKDWLETYYQDNGKLSGHISHHVPGVEFSTGSLGHGLPVACGMAMAAKQAGRGLVPAVELPLDVKDLPARFADFDLVLFFYEGGGESLRTLVKDQKRIALITGAEGGFSPEEAAALTAAGAVPVGLGRRILRCETAPVAGLAAVMTLAGQLE